MSFILPRNKQKGAMSWQVEFTIYTKIKVATTNQVVHDDE